MNEKHLLVNSITLLYRSYQLDNVSDDFSGIVREVLSTIKTDGLNLGGGTLNKVIASLKNTVTTMCAELSPQVYDKTELLQRVKIDTEDEVDLYEAIVDSINQDLSEAEIKRFCLNIVASLQSYLKEKKVTEILNSAAYKLKFQKESINDFKTFVNNVCTQLEPFQISTEEFNDPAIISAVTLSNTSKLKDLFQEGKEKNIGIGKMVTGYQGLNRMLDGGATRGEEIVIAALQHNYKTGFSLSVFASMAMLNEPYMKDEKKKPLMVRISFEDDLTNNIIFLYQWIKENELQQPIDIKDISVEEMSDYVYKKMSQTGYEVDMLRVDPTKWSYRDIINYCLRKEAEGYEIHVLAVDYLAMVPTTGCTIGPMGSDMRDMYRRIRNFTNPRGIIFITPHQLSTDAKMMIREGRTDFVRELPGKGFYDKCKTVDNEVDVEIFIHIEKSNGRSYLTIQRGKHRKVKITPQEYLHCILPFHPVLNGIMMDIYGSDTTCSKVGGGPIGSKDEQPFWEM